MSFHFVDGELIVHDFSANKDFKLLGVLGMFLKGAQMLVVALAEQRHVNPLGEQQSKPLALGPKIGGSFRSNLRRCRFRAPGDRASISIWNLPLA